MLRLFLLLGILFLQVPVVGQSDWKQVKHKDGIRVFTRLNEGYDFKEFKGEMVVEASLSEFVALLQDIEGLPKWGYKIKSAELLEKYMDTTLIYYVVADTPFPYHDRDAVYKNVYSWNNASRQLVVDIEVIEFPLEREEDLVAMTGFGSWEVRPLEESRLEISFQMQVDPGGGIPAWLSNIFAGDSPYHTLRRLKEKLKDPAYKQKQFSFLE